MSANNKPQSSNYCVQRMESRYSLVLHNFEVNCIMSFPCRSGWTGKSTFLMWEHQLISALWHVDEVSEIMRPVSVGAGSPGARSDGSGPAPDFSCSSASTCARDVGIRVFIRQRW